MPKILIVEDDDVNFTNIEYYLRSKAEVLQAETLDKGESLFQNNPDIDLIIMDACIPGDSPNAMPLVKKIVDSGYDKPIIACSSESEYTKQLVAAGATHSANKGEVAQMALKLLGL
jgi:DNA-binding response OmpR family regulator